MAGIRRHEAMRPLSRHHHHALMAAMDIRKTLAADRSEDAVERVREKTLQFWETDGNAHFREEEEILMPAYSRYASVEHEELIQMWVEHVQVRALITAISDRDGDLIASLEQLSQILEQHVRREERVIFPMMEEALPEAVLAKLAPYFHEFHDGTICDPRKPRQR